MSRGRITASVTLAFLAFCVLWGAQQLAADPEPTTLRGPVAHTLSERPRSPEPVPQAEPPAPATELASEGVTVRCDLDFDEPVVIERLVAFGRRRGIRLDGQIEGTQLVFVAPGPEGEGIVQLAGYERALLSWTQDDDGQRCTMTPPQQKSAFVQGRVHAAVKAMDGAVWVEGCGSRTGMLDSSGGFTLDAVPQTCLLRACRQEGQLRLCGEAVQVALARDGELLADLQAPEYRPAGIGIELWQERSGIRIGRVLKDTPGWYAGLEQGDLIMSVDGESVEGMNLEEFISWAVGPEGTDVAIEIQTQEGIEEVVIRRGFVN